jgi:hypothetical protein
VKAESGFDAFLKLKDPSSSFLSIIDGVVVNFGRVDSAVGQGEGGSLPHEPKFASPPPVLQIPKNLIDEILC